MFGTYEARFENGIIKMKEQPPEIKQARVLVTFLPEEEEDRQRTEKKVDEGLSKLRRIVASVPSSQLLAAELIADRRREIEGE